MTHEQSVRITPAFWGENEPPTPIIADRRCVAIEYLHKAFRERRPLAVLAGHWTPDASYIIRNFLAVTGSDVSVVRIDKTCSDVLEGMREVIRATGFERQDMTLTELESMFTKFLFFQRARHRRTIFLLEETRDNGGWVRDTVRHLVALETAGKFGLMTVLFRQSRLRAPLNGGAPKRDTAPATTNLVMKPPRLFAITPIIQPSGAEVGSMSVDLGAQAGSRRQRPP